MPHNARSIQQRLTSLYSYQFAGRPLYSSWCHQYWKPRYMQSTSVQHFEWTGVFAFCSMFYRICCIHTILTTRPHLHFGMRFLLFLVLLQFDSSTLNLIVFLLLCGPPPFGEVITPVKTNVEFLFIAVYAILRNFGSIVSKLETTFLFCSDFSQGQANLSVDILFPVGIWEHCQRLAYEYGRWFANYRGLEEFLCLLAMYIILTSSILFLANTSLRMIPRVPVQNSTQGLGKDAASLTKSDRSLHDTSCCICLDRTATHAFIPCGHRCCCAEHAIMLFEDGTQQAKCPYCRAAFTGRPLHIYDL